MLVPKRFYFLSTWLIRPWFNWHGGKTFDTYTFNLAQYKEREYLLNMLVKASFLLLSMLGLPFAFLLKVVVFFFSLSLSSSLVNYKILSLLCRDVRLPLDEPASPIVCLFKNMVGDPLTLLFKWYAVGPPYNHGLTAF